MKSFQSQLGSVKNLHSNNVLVHKGVLLEAIINKDVSSNRLVGVKTLSWLLGTKRRNIHRALMWQRSLQISSTSQFDLFRRKERLDGLANDNKTLVQLWWTNETWVNPNKKDVIRNCTSPKQHKEHGTHFLLESQISAKALLCSCFVIPNSYINCRMM
jgi:hypothetical protein